ncbi:hypothetical protein PG991_014038 [Apiospora marii]|uniref:AB hydrolase-1 domain-containing protein n=1 Tax=Apiospora marii TaxID=335849 RepID=A0ABR1R8L0_9PEZI
MSRLYTSAAFRIARLSPFRPACAIRQYSSGTRLTLAYDHHTPSKDGRDVTDSPIIVMHGLFGSKKNNRGISKSLVLTWKSSSSLNRVLAQKLNRHVFAIDLRNHGESPHDHKHDYTAMADDVAGFIEEHKLVQPSLLGHSMGAKAAMALALAQPTLVRDIVSVDNAPVNAILESSFGKYVQGMKRIEEAGVTKQSEADKILQDYEQELPVRQFLLGNLHRPSPADPQQKFRVPLSILGRQLDQMGGFPFTDPDRARFERPALFVRGTKSKYVPDEVIPLIGRFFPRFQLVDVDAGHWLISEKPEEFLKAVIEFLEPKE